MKHLAALTLMLSLFCISHAQWAVGLRPSLSTCGGFDDRRRAELSLMTPKLGEKTRLEFNFGWGNRDILVPNGLIYANGQQTTGYDIQRQYWYGTTAMIQWTHKVFWKLYYYAGLGASVYSDFDNMLYIVGANMQFGLEIKLNIPLQVTIDYRPMLDLLDGLAYHHTIALGLRYKLTTKQPEPEPAPNFIQKLKKRLNSKD